MGNVKSSAPVDLGAEIERFSPLLGRASASASIHSPGLDRE